MDAPIGFLVLHEAVDIVGRKLVASSWHSFDDKAARENAVWSDEAFANVIKIFAEGCETGQIVAAYRSSTGGADALESSVWQMPHWRNYFVTGTIDLVDLPLNDENGRPVPDGRTVPRCTREIFVRRDSLDRFIKVLVPPAAAASRYPGDAALIEEGRRLIASGMEKRAVARALASRAEGSATFESKVDRLRKAL